MPTEIDATSIQLEEQASVPVAANSGHVRLDGAPGSDGPELRITDDAGDYFTLGKSNVGMPTWDTADWFGMRAGGPSIFGVGISGAFAGTLSAVAPGSGVAARRPLVQVLQTAAIANNAHVSSGATYNYTDPIYNPDLYMELETKSASDLINNHINLGFYSSLPGNIVPSTLTTRHFSFTAAANAVAGSLKVQYNDAGTTVQSDPLVAGVPTALVLSPNLPLRLRIKLTPAECYWYIDDLEVYHVVFGATLTTPMPLGVSMSWVTTVAVAKNWYFGDFMVIHRR